MEDTLGGVKAYIEATLATELTTIGTERGVTVPPWRELRTSRVHPQAHPSIEILPVAVEYEYVDGTGPFPIPIEFHAVTVRVFQVRTATTDALADIMRYAEGIRRVTFDDDTYGGRFHDVRLVSAQFSEDTEPQDEAAPYRDQVEIGLRIQITGLTR